MSHTYRTRSAALLAAVMALGAPAAAADLQPETARAYEAYAESARRAFASRARTVPADAASRDGILSAGPAREDGIMDVSGGLIHHWVSRAFLRGATLARALEVSRAYGSYHEIYESVLSARVLSVEGDTYRVLTRIREGEAGVTAVLDIRSIVRYSRPDARSSLALSRADEIREIENAGRPNERLLPAGRDSGYLWRADTFMYLLEQPQGLYVELETIGLSRGFPPLLGWLIEPIARRLGRKSVETSLREYAEAIRSPRSFATLAGD